LDLLSPCTFLFFCLLSYLLVDEQKKNKESLELLEKVMSFVWVDRKKTFKDL